MSICLPWTAFYTFTLMVQLLYATEADYESRRSEMIALLMSSNLKKNGWSTIFTFGQFPNEFYNKLQSASFPFVISNLDCEDHYIDDVVPFYSNAIVINLLDFGKYMDTMAKVMNSPYWHPHANIILYHHEQDKVIIPRIFFSLWYYKAINAIIVQYNDDEEVLLISYYTPYTSDNYKLDYLHGCYTSRKITMPIFSMETGFVCETGCHNVSLKSKFRSNNLGTCISFSTIEISYNGSEALHNLTLFEDKTKDLHGFTFRAYVTEVEPFLYVKDLGNGSYNLDARDGYLWNTMSKLMNFSIDLTPSLPTMKETFSFELNINQLFNLAHRMVDLYLLPIYLFDLAVFELDYSFPYSDSGACIMSTRAGFETTLFDGKMFNAHRNIIIQFSLCFVCIWIIFSLYQMVEKRCFSFDQIGKDFLNAIRNILMITLHNPPKRRIFRIFLTTSLWSFFVINFATQATIISLLTAAKRGKDVDTFEDIIEKGFLIYGMASPDVILPDTEERFNIINSRLVPAMNQLECVTNLTVDNQRFCLIDCTIGRYFSRNKLNAEGEQYLHIAEQDRMHGLHLTIILFKHSPLSEKIDKYLMSFLEAGLISKWEKYRYTVIKQDAPIKPLGLNDFKTVFDIYCISLGFIFTVFLLELIIYNIKRFCKYNLKRRKNSKIN